MSTMRAPDLAVPGWRVEETPTGTALFQRRYSGLQALYSIDLYDGETTPPMGPGEYAHISLSRPDRYPGWDEMRDFIYASGLFDASRAVVMLLPPPELYVNLHNNCFHFYQKREAPA